MYFILFLLELIAFLNISKYTLHLDFTTFRWRRFISLLLILFWSGYVIFSYEPAPNTFILFPLSLFLYQEKWYFKTCLVFVYTLFINITANVNVYLYCMISGTHSVETPMYYVCSDILVFSCIILVTFLFRKKCMTNAYSFRTIKPKGYLLIIFVTIIDFFLASVSGLLFYGTINTLGRYLLVTSIAIMIVMSILLLIIYFRLQYYHSLLQESHLINQKMLALEEQHYKELRQKNEDLRAFRHDYNFHITAMQGLISNDDLTGLKEYVTNLSNIKEKVYYIATNHPIADAIVNYFYEKLSKDIIFEVEGKFPENTFVDDSDLCVVLSNLLKNAAEAVEKEEAGSKPKIFLSLFANTEYFTLLIENTATRLNTETSAFATTKKDTVNHGFGLRNVETVAKKYQGHLNLQHNENLFSAYCYLRNIK